MVSIMGMIVLLVAQVVATPEVALSPDVVDLGMQLGWLSDSSEQAGTESSALPGNQSSDAAGRGAIPDWACELTPIPDLPNLEVKESVDESALLFDGAMMLSFESLVCERSFVLFLDVKEIGYTPLVLMFENGASRTVQLDVENILEQENGCELSLEADALAIAMLGGGQYGVPGGECVTVPGWPYWTRYCRSELPDGRIRLVIDMLIGERWVRVYDSGWIRPQPPESAPASGETSTEPAAGEAP